MSGKTLLQDNESGGKIHNLLLACQILKNLKSYSSRTKIWPSQPHSIWTPVLDFHQKSRQSGYLRKLVSPV